MSEPSPLVPDLKEMMEEYAEMEEETVHATQAETEQKGEIAEARGETKQLVEDTRKRRGSEEARAERREEKACGLVSECPYFAYKDKLQHKGFIGERGFNKLISPFLEIVESKG